MRGKRVLLEFVTFIYVCDHELHVVKLGIFSFRSLKSLKHTESLFVFSVIPISRSQTTCGMVHDQKPITTKEAVNGSNPRPGVSLRSQSTEQPTHNF